MAVSREKLYSVIRCFASAVSIFLNRMHTLRLGQSDLLLQQIFHNLDSLPQFPRPYSSQQQQPQPQIRYLRPAIILERPHKHRHLFHAQKRVMANRRFWCRHNIQITSWVIAQAFFDHRIAEQLIEPSPYRTVTVRLYR